MRGYIFPAGIVLAFSFVMLPGAPARAITAKQKMETCKFGADHPDSGHPLAGEARKHFIARCMLDRNDPRGPAIGTPAGASAPKG